MGTSPRRRRTLLSDQRLYGTKRLQAFLLGHRIEKSLSPYIQNALFEEYQLPASYSLHDISEEELASEIAAIRKDSVAVLGFNVTAPFKEKLLEHVDSLDKQATAIKAVNTVTVSPNGGEMKGYNTDVEGIGASLRKLRLLPAGGHFSRPHNAVLFGAGGAAKACLYVLMNAGFHSVVVANRTVSRAEELVATFCKDSWGCRLVVHSLSDHSTLTNAISAADLLINAISETAAWEGNLSPSALLSRAKRRLKVLDLGYKRQSPLLKAAEARGLRSLDGFQMLISQAAKSFEIWTGITPPPKILELIANTVRSKGKY